MVYQISTCWLFKKGQTDPVRITAVNPRHSDGCVPSKDQLVLAKTKAGIYGKEQQIAMKELLKLMDLNKGKNIPGHNCYAKQETHY